ncbi:MAG: hypothetical protein NUV67_01165 [archaeon]|nr:hypothetical protein [archaeon]
MARPGAAQRAGRFGMFARAAGGAVKGLGYKLARVEPGKRSSYIGETHHVGGKFSELAKRNLEGAQKQMHKETTLLLKELERMPQNPLKEVIVDAFKTEQVTSGEALREIIAQMAHERLGLDKKQCWTEAKKIMREFYMLMTPDQKRAFQQRFKVIYELSQGRGDPGD